MKGFFVRATRVTPSIYFNPDKGLLDIRGKSSPENPIAFYSHVQESIVAFGDSTHNNLTVNIALEYFNTSSSKCIYILLTKINDLKYLNGKEIEVNWYYEEEDEGMMEAGEDLSSFFDFDFNYISVPEIKILGEIKED